MAAMKTPKPQVDWELIEREYRANIKTVRQIATENEVSHTAVQKRATKFGWARDLSEKVQQHAQSLVAKQLVARSVASQSVATKLTDAQTTKAYGEQVAAVDLMTRDDLQVAMDTTRSNMQDLALLSRPELRDYFEELAEANDRSTAQKPDRDNEAYRYAIDLPGRIKMAKELAMTWGTYVPMIRKIFGLDAEKKKTSEIDELVKSIQGIKS